MPKTPRSSHTSPVAASTSSNAAIAGSDESLRSAAARLITAVQRNRGLALGGLAMGLVFVWSYWSTFLALGERWYNVEDYSHGFLVIPIALALLWYRRESFPQNARPALWAGLGVLLLALAIRVAGARLFLPAFDGWSISVWLAGAVLLFGGGRLLWWCLPSLVFLYFMIPLPYRLEHALGEPLQRVAATASSFTLQSLGMPAVQEGTVIIVDDQTLKVNRECSGLRMLMGVAAVAFVCAVLMPKPWWQKLMLLGTVAPVAVAANVFRITTIAVLYQYVSTEASRKVSHDWAGLLTTLVAVLMFSAVLWCLGRLFIEAESVRGSEFLLRQDPKAPTGIVGAS